MSEEYEIVGKLIAQGEAWELLELAPREITFDRGVRRILREVSVEFLVLVNGNPQYILVYGGFVIIPKVEPEEEVLEKKLTLTDLTEISEFTTHTIANN